MNKKKMGKYFLYAIGEILILVIGIFFALQVNRRDQQRLNRIEEIAILKAIRSDLEKDLFNLQEDVDLHEGGIKSSFIVRDHLENDLPYNDTLASHFIAAFYVTYWMYNSGGIQTLKSLGVNAITNDSIRTEVINLYDVQYSLLQFLSRNLNESYSEGVQNILRSRFEEAELFGDYEKSELFNYEMAHEVWERWDEKMIPLDYEALKIDNEYLFHLKTHMNRAYMYLVMCHDTELMINRLISNLGEEINRLEQ